MLTKMLIALHRQKAEIVLIEENPERTELKHNVALANTSAFFHLVTPYKFVFN